MKKIIFLSLFISSLGLASGGSGSPYWHNAVTNAAALPASDTIGACRTAKDTGLVYCWDGAAWQTGSGGSGTVTSVAATGVTGILAIAGSPVTTTGTLAFSLSTQVKNKVFVGPNTGSDAAPTFRLLTGSDLPLPGASALGGVFSKAAVSHNFLTSISSADGSIGQAQPAFTDISGTLAATAGGTGLTSGTSGGIPYFSGTTTIASSGALTAHGVVIGGGAATSPASTSAGTTGYVLTSNGASADPTFQAAAPFDPSFGSYTHSGGTTITAGGALLLFNNRVQDANSAYDTSSGIFTAPSTGTWRFVADVNANSLTAAANAEYFDMEFLFNKSGGGYTNAESGELYYKFPFLSAAGGQIPMHIESIIDLTAGDLMQVQWVGSQNTQMFAGAKHNRMYFYRIH